MRRKRTIYRRLWYMSKRNAISSSLLIRLVILAVIIILAGSYLSSVTFKAVADISETKARELISEAVNSTMKDYSVKTDEYGEYVSIDKDANGNTTAVKVNYAALNNLSQELKKNVGERLALLREKELGVPLGVLSGNELLSSYGPELSVKIIPAGNIETEFESDFLQAGINQTKHSITLRLKAVLWVMALYNETRTEIVIDIPVTETIIVGDVPATYHPPSGL